MEMFWKATAAVMIALILTLTLGKQEKDISIVLTTVVCCMVMGIAVFYLEPVLEFLRELEALGDLQNGVLGILLKALGIGLVSQLAGMVCADAGNTSLGKTMEILGGAAILYLSIPIFSALLELIQEILGQI